MKMRLLFAVFLIANHAILFTSCNRTKTTDPEIERVEIQKAVNDCIGWALTKDLDLLFNLVAQDSSLLIINPDSSRIEGFDEFRDFAESFWMDPRFKATRFEIKNLRITLSKSGTVAWYSCLLDDLMEWDGRPGGWKNVRWTGIVEKRGKQWVHTQMHFSFPKVKN